METKKIKVGQLWKTREGEKVRVLSVYDDSGYPVYCDNRKMYTKDGFYLGADMPVEFDLVELLSDTDEQEIIGEAVSEPAEVHGEPLQAIDYNRRAEHIAQIVLQGMQSGMLPETINRCIELYNQNAK